MRRLVCQPPCSLRRPAAELLRRPLQRVAHPFLARFAALLEALVARGEFPVNRRSNPVRLLHAQLPLRLHGRGMTHAALLRIDHASAVGDGAIRESLGTVGD
jgi:hypothetical protein